MRIPESDEQVETLAALARPRVAQAMRLPQFTPSMAEANVFDVAGYRDLVEPTIADVKTLGPAALQRAHAGLVAKYGGRNPQRGWIGFVIFAGVLAAGLSAAFATGFRNDAGDVQIVAISLAVFAAVCEVVALGGSRLRPMNRFVLRMQAFTCIALAIATGLSLSHGLTGAALVQGVCTLVAIVVALSIVIIRGRHAPETTEIDQSIAHAYLEAIADVERSAREAQARLTANLGPAAAALIVRVRTSVFESLATESAALADFDPDAPAGAALITSNTDPKSWLPASAVKSM